MSKTILQIPMPSILRNQAAVATKELGFSSIQEFVRVMLNNIVQTAYRVTYEPEPEVLPRKVARRLDKLSDEIDKGKVKLYRFETVDELFHHLEKKNK